jgi:gluconate 2-dehydrogenase gamma chain
MKRRDAIRNIALSGFGLGVVEKAKATELPPQYLTENPDPKVPNGRTKEEAIRDERLKKEIFFTPHELKTVTVLSDIILPADSISGSASQVGVPAFIEFMMKDKPENQTPMRGGLMWLDNQARKRFEKKFLFCTKGQQLEIIDDIAYPEKAKTEHKQGVAFFNLMRNLVVTGFYTTEVGFRDLGYVGNRPNNWEGVPADVLKQYGLTGEE